MAEYISREAAVALIEERQKELCPVGRWSRHELYGTDREKFDAWQEIIDAMNGISTVDAVVVTRCKDCKHYGNHPNGLCYLHTAPKANARGYSGKAICVEPDGFCSCGEPKEG